MNEHPTLEAPSQHLIAETPPPSVEALVEPVVEPALEAVATEPVAAAVESGHETILVVEDDKLVRDYVLTQLHSLGYVTLDAANATEALILANSGHSFDLLFTDVIMPGMNGAQLAYEMVKIRPGLKVLFTSGYAENAIIHHGRLDEGVLLLAKPYRKSDMAMMVRKALAGSTDDAAAVSGLPAHGTRNSQAGIGHA